MRKTNVSLLVMPLSVRGIASTGLFAQNSPAMQDVVNVTRYPLDRPDTPDYAGLISDCQNTLARDGLFNLPEFLLPESVVQITRSLTPLFASEAFTHSRCHNIYFKPEIPQLPDGHPALQKLTTVNHTLCADQLASTALGRLYLWPPFARFLATVMRRGALHPMADPLAGVNAMTYHDREALNWHFDRSEFTTTLLLQKPDAGGDFEYCKDLRTQDDPNYDGVAELLSGKMQVTHMPLQAGTLNVFRGRNTAHRVTPVQGGRARMIAVFSYFDRPGVTFSESERLGFYGRRG